MPIARSLTAQFPEVFRETMSEQISESEESIFEQLRDSGAFIIRDPTEQEEFFLSESNLDDFFALHLPDLVSFDEPRLTAWSTEALAFVKNNGRHPQFTDIFANRLHYDASIKNLLRYDFSTNGLREYLVTQMPMKTVYISDEYPVQFRELIKSFAEGSIRGTLTILASELASQGKGQLPICQEIAIKVARVKKEPSFKDIRGAVPFIIRENRLAIGGSTVNAKASDYKVVLERALKNLRESNCLQRIHNKDMLVGKLVSEFEQELVREGGVAVALLWCIGQDIDRRLKLHQSSGDAEDVLDESDLFYVNSFMTAHNLYLQCFDMTDTIAQDLERSAAIYNRLDAQAMTAPWQILEQLGAAETVVEARSGHVMKKASASLISEPRTKGMVAIGLGLLRGSLHAIGGMLIDAASEVLTKTAATLGVDGVVGALKQDGVYQPMLLFLETHIIALLRLSGDIPQYFGWLRRFAQTFGLG